MRNRLFSLLVFNFFLMWERKDEPLSPLTLPSLHYLKGCSPVVHSVAVPLIITASSNPVATRLADNNMHGVYQVFVKLD